MKPVAACTIDHTGCQHVSTDCAAIERIAEAGSSGRTEVVYLVTLSAANAAIEERGKRIAELEAELDQALNGKVVPSLVWMRQMELTKQARDRAASLEAMAGLIKSEAEAMIIPGDELSNDLVKYSFQRGVNRAARSIAAKIGARNGKA